MLLARDSWADIVRATKGVYRDNLIFDVETRPYLRGHWTDRLPAIEEDLAKLEAIWRQKAASAEPSSSEKTAALSLLGDALASAATPPRRPCGHVPPESFRPGEPVVIEMSVPPDQHVTQVRLHYRHVNHAEEMQIVDFVPGGDRYRQTIPGGYTNSLYPLIYFFELREHHGAAWFSPGLAPDLANQPYYLLRPQRTG